MVGVSHPTILGPWFVVQRMEYNDTMGPLGMRYYTSMDDGGRTFTAEKKRALIFASLHSASSVAAAETAEVRVLSSREDAKEFGHD